MFCESKVEKHKSRQEKGINFNPHANSIEDCSQYTLDGHNCCRHNWLSTTVFYKWSQTFISHLEHVLLVFLVINWARSLNRNLLILLRHLTQATFHAIKHSQPFNLVQSLRPKKILCFGQPDPSYRNRPTLDFFFTKIPRFFSSLGSL